MQLEQEDKIGSTVIETPQSNSKTRSQDAKVWTKKKRPRVNDQKGKAAYILSLANVTKEAI